MVVVGISPGTRYMGFAILRDRKLVKWQLLSFPDKWSPEKLQAILSSLDNYIGHSRTQAIAIKIPDELPISESYIQLVGAINVLCERKKIQPLYYTLKELKLRFCDTKTVNKHCLAKAITRVYPELEVYVNQKNNADRLYYEKIFEAVAAAHALQNEV